MKTEKDIQKTLNKFRTAPNITGMRATKRFLKREGYSVVIRDIFVTDDRDNNIGFIISDDGYAIEGVGFFFPFGLLETCENVTFYSDYNDED